MWVTTLINFTEHFSYTGFFSNSLVAAEWSWRWATINSQEPLKLGCTKTGSNIRTLGFPLESKTVLLVLKISVSLTGLVFLIALVLLWLYDAKVSIAVWIFNDSRESECHPLLWEENQTKTQITKNVINELSLEGLWYHFSLFRTVLKLRWI